jgi:sugar/nucleoside kinase (ribokinase family)
MFDVCVIGHVTRDVNTYDGAVHEPTPGGAAFYASMAYRSLGLETVVVTRIAEDDRGDLLDEMLGAGIEVICRPSPHSTFFHNIYPSADLDIRLQRVTAIAAAFEPGDVAGVKARAFHFGPLTRGDLPVSLIEAAADTGAYVALGVQGFLRVVRNGEVVAAAWPGLREGLRRVDACQGDVEETCLLAGESEVSRAMANLAEMGPGEVLTTEGGYGSYLFWRGRMVGIPALAPLRLVDATGCGDTYLAGYVARRLETDDARQCARFGAVLASLKLEAAGPFRGEVADIFERLPDLAGTREIGPSPARHEAHDAEPRERATRNSETTP